MEKERNAKENLHEIKKHAILAKESSEKSLFRLPISYLLLMLTQLEVRKSSTNTGIRIFSFHGEIDETNVDSTFPNIMNDIGDFSGARTLFSLGELTYLNSKSIGYIADIAQRTEDGAGKFALCALTSEVHDTLDLVGITNIIPVYDTEEAALVELSK